MNKAWRWSWPVLVLSCSSVFWPLLSSYRTPFVLCCVFKGMSPVLVDALAVVVHRECPGARLVMPIYEPVVGALLLGMELDCTLTDRCYEQLSASLEESELKYGVRFKSE